MVKANGLFTVAGDQSTRTCRPMRDVEVSLKCGELSHQASHEASAALDGHPVAASKVSGTWRRSLVH